MNLLDIFETSFYAQFNILRKVSYIVCFEYGAICEAILFGKQSSQVIIFEIKKCHWQYNKQHLCVHISYICLVKRQSSCSCVVIFMVRCCHITKMCVSKFDLSAFFGCEKRIKSIVLFGHFWKGEASMKLIIIHIWTAKKYPIEKTYRMPNIFYIPVKYNENDVTSDIRFGRFDEQTT